MIKVISLVKRRPDMTVEQFRAHYEAQHARAGQAVFPGRAVRYFRRYFQPIEHPTDGSPKIEPEFDAIMELWFENEAAMKETLGLFVDSPLGDYIVEDEKGLFDRSKIRMFIVEEEETDLDALPHRNVRQAEEYLGIPQAA